MYPIEVSPTTVNTKKYLEKNMCHVHKTRCKGMLRKVTLQSSSSIYFLWKFQFFSSILPAVKLVLNKHCVLFLWWEIAFLSLQFHLSINSYSMCNTVVIIDKKCSWKNLQLRHHCSCSFWCKNYKGNARS